MTLSATPPKKAGELAGFIVERIVNEPNRCRACLWPETGSKSARKLRYMI